MFSKARYTVKSVSIRRNEKIALHCTVRGAKAEEILERGFKVKEYQLRKENFSANETFVLASRSTSTWVSSTTPASVSTAWTPTWRCAGLRWRRKIGHVGFPHRLTKEDAMKWFQTKYGGMSLSLAKKA
jgi:large subunit ribosomal protein L11e